MNEETKHKNKLTIIFLIVMFLSPVILSWYVFNHTDFIEARGMSNKGGLIDPARPLGDLALIDPLDDQRNDSLFGKWTLAYVTNICEKTCMDNVYTMRQIHLAMDKHSLRVQKALLLTDQSAEAIKDELTEYKGQQVIDKAAVDIVDLLNQFKLDETDDPVNANRLYIIDPLGNLMMNYQPGINPRDIYKDLKKLLRGSRIG